MENGAFTIPVGVGRSRHLRLRIGSVIAAFALIFAALVLVQGRADAVPRNAVAVAVAPAKGAAQINIAQFVCPILLAIRSSFASSPFFSFVVAAINPIIVAFGCAPS